MRTERVEANSVAASRILETMRNEFVSLLKVLRAHLKHHIWLHLAFIWR